MLGDGEIGTITRQLRDLYRTVVYGEDRGTDDWRASAHIPSAASGSMLVEHAR